MLKTQASITLVTGFLGAGKTTLVNHVLQSAPRERIAVMVNDFGEINVDAQLVAGIDGDTVELSNGCICCTIREDLVDSLLMLLRRADCPERIIVESSGVADPVPVASTFAMLAAQGLVALDGIVTVVDVEHFDVLTNEDRDLRDRQLQVADLVVLNKTDLCAPEEVDGLQAQLETDLPDARMIRSVRGEVPLSVLFGIETSELEVSNVEPLDVHVHGSGAHDHDHDHDHDPALHAFGTWTYESESPLNLNETVEALKTLPKFVYRAKGYLFIAKEEVPIVAQVVGRRVRLHREASWNGRAPKTQLVLIGRLSEFEPSVLEKHFEACTRTSSVDRSLEAAMNLVREIFGRPK